MAVIGQMLNNRYHITAQLGAGAMGEVYRATDAQTNQEVAVKLLARHLTFDKEMLERFRREGEALRQLRHPNIVGFIDTFQHDGQQVIVLEYVPGGSLLQLIKRGPLPLDQARRIALELCDALTRAHHLNIVHRDLKPENILMAQDGAAKLTDFGVARLISEGTRLTGTGTQVGTPFYMSPEAWQGQHLDAQTDVWSLGVVLYEMLAGQVPFGGDTLIAVMNKVLTAPLPDLKLLRPDMPPTLVKIIRKMLARDKAKRYPTLRQVAADLEQCALPAQTRPPAVGIDIKSTQPLSPAKPAFPIWGSIAIGAVVLGILCVGLTLGGLGLAAMSNKQAGRSAASTQTVIWANFHATQKAQGQAVSPTETLPQAETALPTVAAQPSPTLEPSAAPPTAAPTIAGPPLVDSVVIALSEEPDNLHPLASTVSAASYVQKLIFVGCTNVDDTGEWLPLGCEQVPTLENGGARLVGNGADQHLEVTYRIRKGWRWTDGTPVTSKDIVYWWHLAMDPDVPFVNRYAVQELYEVVAIDDYTARVTYLSQKQVAAAVAGTLTGEVNFKAFQSDYESSYGADWPRCVTDATYWANIGWLPEHILASTPGSQQAGSSYARAPVGDGPYVLKDWKPGEALVLEKSDEPFLLGDPHIKTVTFRIYGDAASVLAALQSGEADAAAGNTAGLNELNGQTLDALEKGGRYKVEWAPGYVLEHIDLNTTKPPLDDVRVRQALYLALDRQQLSDTIYFGKKVVTDLPLPKGHSWAYPPNSNLAHYAYDLAKARALLAEAGWNCVGLPCTKQDKAGKQIKLEITLITTTRADRQTLAQAVQAMWNKINVAVSVQSLPFRSMFDACSAGGPLSCRTFNAGMYAWLSDDAALFYNLYACSVIPSSENNWSGQNYPGWCNQAATSALNYAENDPATVLSRDKRLPYLKTFFQEFANDVPVIYLFSSAEPFPHLVNWKSFKPPTPQGSYWANYWTWNSWEWEVSK